MAEVSMALLMLDAERISKNGKGEKQPQHMCKPDIQNTYMPADAQVTKTICSGARVYFRARMTNPSTHVTAWTGVEESDNSP